ncbi:MAG: hypothetical protein M1820_003691 [Bogoriella megaspora]|nr:MAG: hypothetical protein M1820_003691 [Bogoriella megaspora]
MQVSLIIAAIAAILLSTVTAEDCCSVTGTNASVELGNWLECQVNNFFPYPANGAWDGAYDEAFSPDLLATFNQSHFNFDGFKALAKTFNTSIGVSFKKFEHGFHSTVGVPNSNGDKGGFVYATGFEGGSTVLGTDVWYEDAAFAVIKDVGGGERKIVEWRESSNIPVSIPLPPTQEWTCGLDASSASPGS